MEMTPCDVLLVEDNPADAELMQRALRRAGLANPIHLAADGAAALEFLLGDGDSGQAAVGPTPRVVFLDLKLPKVSGLEVLERLRTDERTRTLPIVVVTSSLEEPDVKAAYALGVNSYVVKPVEFEDFARAVTEIGLYWLLVNTPPH